MENLMTQQRNRLPSAAAATSSSSSAATTLTSSIETPLVVNNSHTENVSQQASPAATATTTPSPPLPPPHSSTAPSTPHSPTLERFNMTATSAASSFVNLFDGFASRVSGERHTLLSPSASTTTIAAQSQPHSHQLATISSSVGGSIASITSIGSLGTTANAFYSSIGLAFNSLTSPITAAAAAATATTAEAAAVVVAAASAISNHLSSPTSGSPPRLDVDEDEDCDETDEDNQANHLPAATPRKSWSEIKATVNEMRKQLSNLSSLVPTNIQFRTLSDGRVRCYFLSTPPNSWEATLLYADVHASVNDEQDGEETIEEEMNSSSAENLTSPFTSGEFENGYIWKRLNWNILLQQPISNTSIGSIGGSSSSWSREFQLLQERKRLSTWGITSYELHKPSGKIVFPCFSDLYQCHDTGYNTSPLFPKQLRTNPQWSALDPQICPQNSDLIAYISGCDIWVTHTLSGHEERLTFAHDGRRTFQDDPLSAGVPSYVMQEEFSRYQGYWWQPHSTDGVYRIVYEEVDESDVCLYTFPSSQAIPGEMEEYRFPRTGTANAKSKLKLVQFILNETLQITEVCIKDLPYSLTSVFPWLEYIVRVGWTPDANYVWMEGLNRKQQRLDLVLIPLDNFYETYGSSTSSPSANLEHCWQNLYGRSFSSLQVIYSEISESWINVHDLLHFLEITDTTVTFLWASECTGFRHLYLVTSRINLVGNTAGGFHHMKPPQQDHPMHNILEETPHYPNIINKVALTSGEWEVLGRNLWVDKSKQLVYFLGLRDTPLEKHLYVVSLQRPEHIRLLTEPGYSYLIDFDDSCQLMLQVYSNIQTLPSCKIMRITQTCQSGGVNGLQVSLVGHLHEGGKAEAKYCPLIFRPQLPSGEIVYAMVFKPHNFHIGIKYPTVLNVYGGPEVQTVNNTFKGKHQLRMHMLAAQGYCVVCIDSRGSRHRGLKFESHIRCRMGQVELTDQVDALKILADQLGYIDINRVGIHGWSYGGYLSLMGLVQYPDIFKVAIAGAPVTNWEYYDTGYTERYMDLPQNNRRGYTAGSVLNYIHMFPEDDNRLLLIHGLIDENVHFDHTSQLITALNKANKPYSLLIFPDERHSLRNLESNKKYETKLLSFLQNL